MENVGRLHGRKGGQRRDATAILRVAANSTGTPLYGVGSLLRAAVDSDAPKRSPRRSVE